LKAIWCDLDLESYVTVLMVFKMSLESYIIMWWR